MYPEKFVSLWLSENVLQSLVKKWFEEPSAIQAKCIPLLLTWTIDIVWQAQTGTWKTAAFGIPLVEKLDARKNYVQAIVLTPTRELAIQVAEEISSYCGRKKLKIIPIYGGAHIWPQIRNLKSGVDIVVGTPGRVIDHLERWTLKLDQLDFFVLDEADEMLNMWFLDDVEKILKASKKEKRMLMFSATMPREILHIAKNYMNKYEVISTTPQQMTAINTEQLYFEVQAKDKLEALSRILDNVSDFYGIVFCRTKMDCEWLWQRLWARGYSADALHGDVTQQQRERILEKFKLKQITILVATDVAARGIDVQDLTHVINYTIPQDPESYTHRIWRTWRAGKQWTAITFVTPEEYRRLVVIKRVTKSDIKKEKIPSIDDVISSKKKRVYQSIVDMMGKGDFDLYEKMTAHLLDHHDAAMVIKSLLKLWFDKELWEHHYNPLQEVSIDEKWKSRLFIALGRSQWYGPKEIVDYLKKEVGLDGHLVNDIRVMDEFSFVTLPFEEAELVLHHFERNKKSWRSLVSRAREKSSQWGGSRGGSNYTSITRSGYSNYRGSSNTNSRSTSSSPRSYGHPSKTWQPGPRPSSNTRRASRPSGGDRRESGGWGYK